MAFFFCLGLGLWSNVNHESTRRQTPPLLKDDLMNLKIYLLLKVVEFHEPKKKLLNYCAISTIHGNFNGVNPILQEQK